MNIFNKTWLIVSVFFILPGFTLYSQQKVHVITKTIKKEFPSGIRHLTITGEKSTINVSSWEQNYYLIEIKLISKNLNKEQAEKDLNVIKYDLDVSGDNIQTKNYFSSEKFNKIRSNLSAVYNIKVPKNSTLDIINIYGSVNLRDVQSTIQLKNSFGEISLLNTKGQMVVTSYYSDISAEGLDVDLKCYSDKSDIAMNGVSGNIFIKSNYGNIKFKPGDKLKGLEIKANRTTILFQSEQISRYNYILNTKHAKIILPDKWANMVYNENDLVCFKHSELSSNPFVKIETSYCNISIN